MRDDLLIVPRFLTEEQCALACRGPVVPHHPARHDVSASQSLGHEFVRPIVWAVSDLLATFYEVEAPLFCDYAAATASKPGMGHELHADAVKQDGTENHTPHRLVTAMLYLNQQGRDFGGGSLEFPNLQRTIAPRTGLLVGFRCDLLHSHRVPPVEWGERRALAFWFTTSHTYKDRVAPKIHTVKE